MIHGIVKEWLYFDELTLNINKSKYIAFSLTDVSRPNFSSLQIPKTRLVINESCNIKYLVVKVRRLVYKFDELRKFMIKKYLLSIRLCWNLFYSMT
nr:unnamed protein product [Callosobruchus chinensis]